MPKKELPKSRYGPDGRPLKKNLGDRMSSLNLFIIGGLIYFIFIIGIFLNSGLRGENIFYLLLPFVFFWTYKPMQNKRKQQEYETQRTQPEDEEVEEHLKDSEFDEKKVDQMMEDFNQRRGY